MKIFAFDVETTGLDSQKNGIHQLTFKIIVKGVVVEAQNWRIQPLPGTMCSPEALRMAGYQSVEQFKKASADWMGHQAALNQLKTILARYVDTYNKQDKFIMAGYNCQAFDGQFLRAFFAAAGDNYFGSWFWPNTLDAFVLATPVLAHKRHLLKNFKLETVARELGFDVDSSKTHDAEYDLDITLYVLDECYKKMGLGSIYAPVKA